MLDTFDLRICPGSSEGSEKGTKRTPVGFQAIQYITGHPYCKEPRRLIKI